MTAKPVLGRMAFSPKEFAALFGKSQTWGYRQIYAGRVKAITAYGRTMIAAAEVEAILKTAGIYDGLKPKPAKTKANIQLLAPRLTNAWQIFIAARRQADPRSKEALQARSPKATWTAATSEREAALARLIGKRNGRSNHR
jgi:hypothetical protein